MSARPLGALRRGAIVVIAGATATWGFAALAARGAARTAPSLSFFSHGVSSAHWDNSYSNDSDPFSVLLHVGNSTAYAGATLHHVEGQPPPPMSPSFDYSADQAGPSGGSPRLVIVFGTIGDIELTPDAWPQKPMWAHADDGQWSVHGGPCVFSYHDSYAHAVGCMGPNPIVTSAYIVSDMGVPYPAGFTNWVDNIQYGGYVISQPSDNGDA